MMVLAYRFEPQKAILQEQLPEKPYCADIKGPLRILPREQALKKKLIQLNSPWKQWCMTFDIDRDGGGAAWIDGGLPVPTFTVWNPTNGHAHLTYLLSRPIYTAMGGGGNLKPAMFLSAIENAFIERLKADANYVGLVTKNPWHPHWRTVEDGSAAYELSELAAYVDLSQPKAVRVFENPKGRHCKLFDSLRIWAYLAIREYWGPGREQAWLVALMSEAERLNRAFLNDPKGPLPSGDVRSAVRSVWRWTWRHFTPSNLAGLIKRTHTPELQQVRARRRW
jgi:hypothetical protein